MALARFRLPPRLLRRRRSGKRRGPAAAGLAPLLLSLLSLPPLAFLPSLLLGPEAAAEDTGDPAQTAKSERRSLETAWELPPGRPAAFAQRILEPYDRLRERARERLGLDYQLAYSLLFQRAGRGGGGSGSLIGQLHVQALWELLEDARFGSGSLGLYFVDLRGWLGASPTELSESLDSGFLPNDSDVDGASSSLQELWWEQRLLGGRLGLVAGQLDLSSLMSTNTYADDDTVSFLAQPLSGHPVSGFPPAGLGAYLELVPSQLLTLSCAFVDADADGRYPDFGSFARGDYLYAGELALTPTLEGIGSGRYRFTGYYAERTATQPSASGFALSFEQALGDAWGLFLRYQVAFENPPTLRQALGLGAVARRPFGRAGDWLGFAFMWGEPSDAARRHDFGLEIYWRLLLGRRLELTPDLQLHVDPGRDRPLALVGGLRLRLVL